MANNLCIGFLEYISVGKGIEAADLIAKNTDVTILLAAPNCPGRYQILFNGDVGAVKEALKLAKEIAEFNFLDSLILPRVDEKVVAALYSSGDVEIGAAVGIFETMTMTATILGADVMVKSGEVDIIELRLGKGLAGKSYVIVSGTLQDVESAISAAKETVKEEGIIISAVVVKSLSRELIRHLV